MARPGCLASEFVEIARHLSEGFQNRCISVVTHVRIARALERKRTDIRRLPRHRLGFAYSWLLVRTFLRLHCRDAVLRGKEWQRDVIRSRTSAVLRCQTGAFLVSKARYRTGPARPRHFRSSLNSGGRADVPALTLRAKNGLMHRSK